MEKSSTNTQQFFNNTGAPCPSSTIAANPVSLSVTVQDTHTRYNGFEDLQSQNQQHNPTNIDYNSLTCTDTNDGSPTNTAVFCYSYIFWRGSVKRVKFSTHVNPLNFFKQSTHTLPRCIVDSNTTHHILKMAQPGVLFINSQR